MKTKVKLKRCPFCGKAARKATAYTFISVGCPTAFVEGRFSSSGCRIHPYIVDEDEATAIKLWNKRA